jgi:hypothetical protein
VFRRSTRLATQVGPSKEKSGLDGRSKSPNSSLR